MHLYFLKILHSAYAEFPNSKNILVFWWHITSDCFLNIYSLVVALSKIVSNNTLFIVLLGWNVMSILTFIGHLYSHDIRKNNVIFQKYSNSRSLYEKYIKES